MILGAACGNVSAPKVPDAATDAAMVPADASPDAPPDAPSNQLPAAPTGVTLSRGAEAGALGDLGGDLFSDACPGGQALIGVSGATGLFNGLITVVGQVAGHCATIGVGAVSSNTYPLTATTGMVLTARGAGNTAAYSLTCPANQFVVGLTLRAGSALDQINLECAAVTLTASSTTWVGRVGTATTVGPGGGGGGAGPIAASCPTGQIATILHSRVMNSTTSSANVGLPSGVMVGCRTVTGK